MVEVPYSSNGLWLKSLTTLMAYGHSLLLLCSLWLWLRIGNFLWECIQCRFLANICITVCQNWPVLERLQSNRQVLLLKWQLSFCCVLVATSTTTATTSAAKYIHHGASFWLNFQLESWENLHSVQCKSAEWQPVRFHFLHSVLPGKVLVMVALQQLLDTSIQSYTLLWDHT